MSSSGEPAGHSAYEGMAVAHVLGGLDEQQGRVFRAHLRECEPCRARVGELRAIASDLAGVERRARREPPQGDPEHAVGTKQRDRQAAAALPPARSPMWPRLAVVALLVAVIGLSLYIFALRGQVARLEQQVADRAVATSVLEHGTQVPLTYQRAGVEATVAVDGGDVAVLVDGLDAAAYQVALVDDSGQARAVPASVHKGRLFVLVGRQDADEQLRVRRGDDQLVVEADLDAA